MPEYVVRYGVMRFLGVFTTSAAAEYRRGVRVIARTERGLEVGDVLCEATAEVRSLLKDPTEGQVLRAMTADDRIEEQQIAEQADREIEVCQKHVDRLGLQMKLVDIEHIFGGERVVVYYLAENRVDFRELVRTLAGEFQTRIEMRQIGVRDEAKLLGDYADCGQPLCCSSHLVQMPPVSMKMAKLQKATLDPTKISGRCGRLKCCLRYEYETYEALQQEAASDAARRVNEAPDEAFLDESPGAAAAAEVPPPRREQRQEEPRGDGEKRGDGKKRGETSERSSGEKRGGRGRRKPTGGQRGGPPPA